MEKKDIYVNKEGVICACTVPFPNEKDFSGDQWKENAALQACKESAVPFDDKFSITVLLIDSFKDTSGKTMHEVMKEKIKPDTFYQIEADWEIVEIPIASQSPTPVNVGRVWTDVKKLARLKVPAATVATDNSGELKEKIEFIKACFQIYVGHDTTKQLEQFLKFSKFEITRKS